jgi:polar amino acid transport system substrate-binding protein
MNCKRILRAATRAVVTLAMLVAVQQSFADALDDIMKAGVLRVAVPQDFPPFGSVNAQMDAVGYDIDMANLLAQKMGVKVQLVPVTSANRIPYLQTNKVDLVISTLAKNPEREAIIDFSDAYAPYFNGVFGPAELKVSKAEDLAGMTVGATRGTTEETEITKMAPASTIIKRYDDNNGTIAAFLSGQVQLVATGNVVAAAFLAKNPPKRPETKFLIKDSPCFVGLNKGQARLQAKVNAIIAAAKKDGTLNSFSMKWLGTPLPATF